MERVRAKLKPFNSQFNQLNQLDPLAQPPVLAADDPGDPGDEDDDPEDRGEQWDGTVLELLLSRPPEELMAALLELEAGHVGALFNFLEPQELQQVLGFFGIENTTALVTGYSAVQLNDFFLRLTDDRKQVLLSHMTAEGIELMLEALGLESVDELMTERNF